MQSSKQLRLFFFFLKATSPVGEDNEGQVLSPVEIFDGLSSLKGGVGVPDLIEGCIGQ